MNNQLESIYYGTELDLKTSEFHILIDIKGNLSVVEHSEMFPLYFDGVRFVSKILTILINKAKEEFVVSLHSPF